MLGAQDCTKNMFECFQVNMIGFATTVLIYIPYIINHGTVLFTLDTSGFKLFMGVCLTF